MGMVRVGDGGEERCWEGKKWGKSEEMVETKRTWWKKREVDVIKQNREIW